MLRMPTSDLHYSSELGALANPHNDVALLERTLTGLGFEVTTVRDAAFAELHQAVNSHVRRVHNAGPGAVSFLFYSGHGAQEGGRNYIIPIDVPSAATTKLWDRSLNLAEITRKLKSGAGNATHFVVFDACRNTLRLRQPGTRSLIQPKGFMPIRHENGMLIAFSTAEGELASDVGEGAGPYASVLAEEIVKPGVEAVVMFRAVQRRVRAAIGQEPYLGFSALGDVYFAGPSKPDALAQQNGDRPLNGAHTAETPPAHPSDRGGGEPLPEFSVPGFGRFIERDSHLVSLENGNPLCPTPPGWRTGCFAISPALRQTWRNTPDGYIAGGRKYKRIVSRGEHVFNVTGTKIRFYIDDGHLYEYITTQPLCPSPLSGVQACYSIQERWADAWHNTPTGFIANGKAYDRDEVVRDISSGRL